MFSPCLLLKVYHNFFIFYFLQAPVLKKYPAKLTLTSFTCFFGLIQFLVIAAFVETDLNHWKIQSLEELFTILYAVITCGFSVLHIFTSWCFFIEDDVDHVNLCTPGKAYKQ